jgi:hypothetical protein
MLAFSKSKEPSYAAFTALFLEYRSQIKRADVRDIDRFQIRISELCHSQMTYMFLYILIVF